MKIFFMGLPEQKEHHELNQFQGRMYRYIDDGEYDAPDNWGEYLIEKHPLLFGKSPEDINTNRGTPKKRTLPPETLKHIQERSSKKIVHPMNKALQPKKKKITKKKVKE